MICRSKEDVKVVAGVHSNNDSSVRETNRMAKTLNGLDAQMIIMAQWPH